MSTSKHVFEYRKQAVNGASPLQLVIMLYDGALRFMEAGRHAIVARDIERQNSNLQKAQRIVSELTSCLDMAQGGEVARNLFALYTFCYNQLVAANVEDRPELVEQAMKIMSELRESWVQLEHQMKNPVVEVQDAAA